MTGPKRADLVLSGGGVKGAGLVGAVVGLRDAGYVPQRISGTSAGSIVGAVVAAAAQTGALTGSRVEDLALQLDYRNFLDPGPVQRVPLLGPALALLRGSGIYRGDYAHEWVRHQLADLGVSTLPTSPSTTTNCHRISATDWCRRSTSRARRRPTGSSRTGTGRPICAASADRRYRHLR